MNCLEKAWWLNLNQSHHPSYKRAQVFSVPFHLWWRDWRLFFPLYFMKLNPTLIYPFLSKKRLSNSPKLTYKPIRELAQLSLDALPVWPTMPDCLPLPDFVITRNVAKKKQLLLNGCVSMQWMQSGSCHSKVCQRPSAGSRKLSISRRSIPNKLNYLQAWLLQQSIIPRSHHFVLIRGGMSKKGPSAPVSVQHAFQQETPSSLAQNY